MFNSDKHTLHLYLTYRVVHVKSTIIWGSKNFLYWGVVCTYMYNVV